MQTTILRIADTIIAFFWIGALVVSFMAGRIGGADGFQSSMAERPGQFWFFIFVQALMVLHFAGLAIVGQQPRSK